MALTLHFHPLSSFCWKALIGLYELDIPFDKHLVDLYDDAARAEFLRLSPIGKFTVLRDDAAHRTIPESTIILEYIDRWSTGKAAQGAAIGGEGAGGGGPYMKMFPG